MSLVSFSASNHPQQTARRGGVDAIDDRGTTDDLFDPLNIEFRFTIDVAANMHNAKLPRWYGIDDDGLSKPWNGERVWCNPPYSNIRAWVEKAWDEMNDCACQCVVMLVPANRTEQTWWQDMVEPFRDGADVVGSTFLATRFLRGRRRFDRPGWTKPAKGDRPPFGLCLLIWERT